MDIHLPVMDGLEATRQIRAWEAEKALKRIPIIALTAGAFDEDKKHCHDAGMDGFMTKPIDIDTLRATLGQWLPRIDGTSGN